MRPVDLIVDSLEGGSGLSASDIWAFGGADVAHWNGSTWSEVAGGNFGFGELQPVSPDGNGGLWLPMPGAGGQKSYVLHYWHGHLTQAALPGGPTKITVDTVALIPGTTELLGGGNTHASCDEGPDVVGIVLQYGA